MQGGQVLARVPGDRDEVRLEAGGEHPRDAGASDRGGGPGGGGQQDLGTG